MWSYHPKLLEKPVPRYTSYPTAADFGDLRPETYRTAIENAQGDISLYVHIPFCEKICFYCGCNTAAAGRKRRLQSYLAALHREIELVGSIVPAECRVRRIAFGGGSPNAIEPEEFLDLLAKLHRSFQISDSAISLELDPRTMTAPWGKAISEAGVTRASMGVQTFAQHCQVLIGREQSDAQICRTIDWLRGAGISSLNFDLMYGLPGQQQEDLQDTLEYASLLGADRIALFGYAHVPHVVPRQRVIETNALPGPAERFAMASLGHDLLRSRGYQAVGFDHFAMPDDPLAVASKSGVLRRNFQGFTDDQAVNLIGLGASAISSFPQLLAQNEKNSGHYRMRLSQDHLAATRGAERSEWDRLHGRIIESILCMRPVEIPPCLFNQVRGQLDAFLERGLAEIEGATLSITSAGVPYARSIAVLFDTFRQSSQRSFSSAV